VHIHTPQVVIKYAATVDLGALRGYMDGQHVPCSTYPLLFALILPCLALPLPNCEQVVIKYAATVDLGALRGYMDGQAMDEELPRSAVQVLEVVMRSGVSGECFKGQKILTRL
jgi:hypothetical protein